MLRKISLIAFLSFVVLFGCSKLKDLVTIDLDLPYSQSMSLPQVAVYDTSLGNLFPTSGVHFSSSLLPVATNKQSIISQYNTAVDKITAFYIKHLSLVDSPSSAKFDFLDSVQVYICKNNNDSTLLAHKYGITTGLDSLSLDIDSSLNLKPYFLQDTFYFKFSSHFVSLPPNSLQKLTIHTTMHLKANPLD